MAHGTTTRKLVTLPAYQASYTCDYLTGLMRSPFIDRHMRLHEVGRWARPDPHSALPHTQVATSASYGSSS